MELDASPIYTIEHLTFQYPTGHSEVLRDINVTISAGEFIVLCGASGCGKTTLLRNLKSAIAVHGNLQGCVYFHGVPLSDVGLREQTARIGFVSQNPEDQIVTDQVWHELAFGLENLGMNTAIIRKRVAEMSQFFGIQNWFHRNVSELSGGQKQLLNLASVMVMQPEILLLDEPTSQLDPIAATEFLNMLHRIHQELGTSIFIIEHRLEEVLPYATRMIFMEQGRFVQDGSIDEIVETLRLEGNPFVETLPAPVRIWNGVQFSSKCPITVQEGRDWLSELAAARELRTMEEVREKMETGRRNCTVELKNLWFRYEKNSPDILRDVSIKAYAGEILAVLGGNGSGKSTMLSMIYGGRKPQRGKVCFPDVSKQRVICLPQNPQLLFVCDTVREELEDMKETRGDWNSFLAKIIEICQLERVLEQHPYDLSGGEQQRLGLAKVLLAEPDILLLDEPTKGLDIEYKTVFADILKQLKKQEMTILMVSHDVDFCAEYADYCALFFDGQVASEGDTHTFFVENYFYTTQAHRMARHLLPDAITVKEVILACGGSLHSYKKRRKEEKKGVSENDFYEKDTLQEYKSFKDSVYERTNGTIKAKKRSLPVKSLVSIFVLLLAIPFTIYAGIHFLNDEKYLFISLLILVEAMLPFFLAFESRRPPARDVVVLAVLCALGVAGRVVFVAIPQFQPVTAIAIIAGAAFGSETGFLTGSVTMLVSNMILGQGTWTPWQMFAMGMIGFFAGVMFFPLTKKGFWEQKRMKGFCGSMFLCIYGFFAVMILYGGIMNPAAALMSGAILNRETLLAYYISGIPFDFIHAISTVFFLLLGAKTILKKLERVKLKFGT